jgi:alpha,alpha-trehalase
MKKLTRFVWSLSLVLILSSCHSNISIPDIENIKNEMPKDAKIVVNNLKPPKVNKEHEFIGGYEENTVLEYSYYNKYNDSSGAIRRLFGKYTEKLQNNKSHTVHISHEQFQNECVIPYINGLWLSTEGLLRIPNKKNIEMLAKEHMIVPDKDISPYCYKMKENGWPVYFPPQFKGLVNERIGGAEGIKLIALPEKKPESKPLYIKNGKWQNQEHLYNHIGLLYLPNSFIVPGGLFNEMFGWDSYFMIIGLINSAEYILKNPNAEIYDFSSGYRKATPEDAFNMFKIAKGMVDNHIFEIFFYGGYILNANRVYTMQRSQPPFLTSEALVVYNFWKEHGSWLRTMLGSDNEEIRYYDTLSLFLEADAYGENYRKPVNYDEWMTREVFPAAMAFFNYYTGPQIVYSSWSPFEKENNFKTDNKYQYVNDDPNPNPNKRVVTVKSSTDSSAYNTARYYTDGEGPCPEVVFSAAPGNRVLYSEVFASYFQRNHDKNTNSIYYDPKTKDLTGWFYKNDRAVRASGFDLSERYGNAGQECLDYCSVALNSLLYQMAEDILAISSNINPANPKFYGLSNDDLVAKTNSIYSWKESVKTYINKELWDTSNSCFADKRTNNRNAKESASEFAYPYITNFCPFVVNAAGSNYLATSHLYPFAPTDDTVCKFQKMLKNDDVKTIYGVTTSFHDTNGATQWDFPIAWAPNEYFVFKALASRKVSDAKIAQGWKDSIDMYFARYGIIIEKYLAYNPLGVVKVSTGYAENNAGFGWTNGMYMFFVNHPETTE